MHMRKSVPRRLMAVWFALSLAGCKTWEPTTATPARLVAEAHPTSVRVTTADGAQVTLKNPLIVNDSIVSAVSTTPGAAVIPPRLGVSENDVNVVEIPRLSVGRTLALAGVIAAVSISWARIQGSGGGTEPRPEPLPKGTAALDLIGVVGLLRGIF